MRLDRVYIDGFKNLRDVEIDFDERRLTTVIIGQNGAGKSNLLEAITDIFRYTDLNRAPPPFRYELDYRIGNHQVRLSNRSGKPAIVVDREAVSRTAFERNKNDVFPDLIFGYYSGGSRRFEKLFDSHQRRYYEAIKTSDDLNECAAALRARRLFYCRPIHGVFALLSFFAFPEEQVSGLLHHPLGITGFHSGLALFREPWFARNKRRKPGYEAENMWGAEGPAGACARAFRESAFHPLALQDKTLDDYRDKGGLEAQYAAFLRNLDALRRVAKGYKDDRDIFYALEATDISDLFRTLLVWVTRDNDTSGDVSFADLSDGERQLLMVLGLIRISRGKRALFLLDEPDTHLNPVWQHSYLNLIRDWTGILADETNCHIVMTSHNPLTIASLQKEEVRVMFTDEAGEVTVSAPYTDPKGMGFTATLTEIFGLPSSLDSETQQLVDDRNVLAKIEERSDSQDKALIQINDKLNRLGFMFEDREPLYQDFLRALRDVRYADRPPLSPDDIEKHHAALSELVRELQQHRRLT
jgi:ABC-type cobalamin/Fe3+-siderophores transport system ATPase subunit